MQNQMPQNPQQKYDELQRLCKRQQIQITRLQNQIRERCQSYLLHSSRYKRPQNGQHETASNLDVMSQSSSRIRKVSEQSGSSQPQKSEKSESKVKPKPIKIYSLTLRKEVEVLVEPSKEIANAKINEMAALTQSFKSRITTLQNNKNEYVKELEKANKQIKDIKHRNSVLQSQMEIISKSQRKMKDKLKKIPEYEQRIDDIYVKLMREIRNEEISEDVYAQKHMNDKLKEIIDWITTSKTKIDNLLEEMSKVEQKEKQEVLTELVQIEQGKQSQEIQQVQAYEPSPSKSQQKVPGESYTIISQLNEVDIKPFQESQVKPYHMANQIDTKNETQENLINTLQENSLIFQEELKQSQNQITQLRSELARNRAKQNQLQEELTNNLEENNKVKEEMDKEIRLLKQELQDSRLKNRQIEQRLQEATSACKRYQEQLNAQEKLREQLNHTKYELSSAKKSNSEIVEQLQKSRIKLSQLVQSKLTNEIQTLNNSLQKQQLNSSQAGPSNSKFTVAQQLEAPYFVEEELENSSNNQYVKRSFIRKKIVKRNLSATAYRIVSKSKEEVEQIMSSKIKEYHDRSKQKAAKIREGEKLSKQAKLSALQSSINRVSEVSEPRDSGINRQEEVRIIEVTTKTPYEQIKTAKIYSRGGESNLSTRRKY